MLKKITKVLTIGLLASSIAFTSQSAFAANYVDEVEPTNDYYNSPTPFTWGDYANGYISSSTDEDGWIFYADSNQNGRPVSVILSRPSNKDYQYTIREVDNGSMVYPDGFQYIIDEPGFLIGTFKLKANTYYRITVYGTGPNEHSTTDKYYLSVE
ncbi:hypothetical protein [Paenibacillus eucommiae]|uniref:Uncharacterized protein n=1 Tax=Paenibacillus eucommiae TaxID=1355755 RepID=A0ABS4IYG9_9BACL|nr:hypothetical protein [Paenibacillus eucommiae]MBP1992629.1 hypothetical protein [Paenibacillus eucommiae]